MSQEILINATWVAVALVVLLLVVYLTGVLIALRRAGNHLERLAGGLKQVASHTGPFEGRIETINGALQELESGLAAVDVNLMGIIRVFQKR